MRSLNRALTALEDLFGLVGKIALLAIMCAVVADAGGRYLFSNPIPGVYEITELYLMLAIVFFGLALTQREGGHVRADIFFDMLPLRVRRGLEIFYLLAAFAVFALIAYAAGRASLQHIAAARWTTGVVPIPTGPSWAIACIGSAVLSLRLALQAALLLLGGDLPGRGHAPDRNT